ncbi:MAG: RibD family protein, partial [Nanoarchaeota archaeon]|nr:RibD family protein [Nanoarchaeota archaeon]
AHRLRDEIGFVMVGINTVLKDDPLLDARLVNGKDTMKLIVDSKLKIPLKAKVLAHPGTVIIAHVKSAPKGKQKQLVEKGVRLISTAGSQVSLKKLMAVLAESGVNNILLEGGSELNAAMIKEKLVDKMMLFTSPKILGGDALSVIGKLDLKDLGKAIQLNNLTTEKVGKDILVQGYL